MAARLDAPVEKYFDLRVFTRESSDSVDKHDPRVCRMVIEKLGVKMVAALCVGNNPYTDFVVFLLYSFCYFCFGSKGYILEEWLF